jgi:hypothetical protein
MTHTIHEVLSRLIELTPPPPPISEIDPLLAAFEAIIAQRAELLDRLAAPLQLGDAERALVLELERRDAAWQDTLSAAMRMVSAQRHGNEQLRAYAAVV